MTRREAERLLLQENTLLSLGFTRAETESLRRISMTLHRWAEEECNGTIERAGDDGDGKPFRSSPNSGRHMVYPIADRERGALRRLSEIVLACNKRRREASNDPDDTSQQLAFYVQGDPRGCALYILRPGDVPDGQRPDGYYSRGVAVY